VTYCLGIDGGGSKTTCVVGDESSRLATAVAGPGNITRVGEARARESLHQAIREACSTAGIGPKQIGRACIGAAGAGRAEVAATVRKIVGELISGEIEVVGDMTIAMQAAFGAGPGVIVIAGTGSIAYGRNELGQTTRAGGWGFAISDEGSAHWIGRSAVADVLRAIDQQIDSGKDAQATAGSIPLFRELEAACKVHSLDEFVHAANASLDFATLLPGINSAADAGDLLAQQVLIRAGAELSRLGGIVIRRLFGESNRDHSAVRLSIAGGVFRHSTTVRKCFTDEMRKTYPQVGVNLEVIEPVAGALEMARHKVLPETK